MRKSYNSSFKTKVALAAIKNDKTMSELSSSYEVHRDQIQKWKKVVTSGLPGLFSSGQGKSKRAGEKLISELYNQIGRLKVENDWLKKKC